MYDFYHMLRVDNQCYIDRRERRSINASPAAQEVSWGIPPPLQALEEQPRSTSTHQSLRQEPPVVQEEGSRSRPPAVYPPGTSIYQAFRLTKNHPAYKPKPVEKRVNPSYNPFIHVGQKNNGKRRPRAHQYRRMVTTRTRMEKRTFFLQISSCRRPRN